MASPSPGDAQWSKHPDERRHGCVSASPAQMIAIEVEEGRTGLHEG
jgi:hypothetical protein